jgi:2-hydroxychromene-2-carboxylate isomerase
MEQIDCWITMGRTYSYLAVIRLLQIARQPGVSLRVRLFKEMGYLPFPPNSPKTSYMWRAIERFAEMYGIPIRLPGPYLAKEVALANKVGLIGLQEGWAKDFIRAAYGRWFQKALEPGTELDLSDSLRECGQTRDRVLSHAKDAETERWFAEETATAKSLGILGPQHLRLARNCSAATTPFRTQSAGLHAVGCINHNVFNSHNSRYDNMRYFTSPGGRLMLGINKNLRFYHMP